MAQNSTPSNPSADNPANAPTSGKAARRAVVTGASSGIGQATVRRLRADGWHVVAVARREDRLAALVEETGAVAFTADVTSDDDVADLAAFVADNGGLDTLINVAGGARGVDRLGDSNNDDWEWMFQVNVLGTMKMIRAFLPALRLHGNGTILNLTSTAALAAYETGAGYNMAKYGQHALTGALRLEEAENNIRVIEVLPGLVRTDEFALNRLGGDQDAAEKVYAGVENPLTAGDVADVISYSVGLPHHINLDQVVVRPVAQAANHKLLRK